MRPDLQTRIVSTNTIYRAYALQRHRPLTLPATIALPSPNDDPTETISLHGFIHLANLFRPFDDTFISLWNKARSASSCSPPYLSMLQKQLTDALPAYLNSTENQTADLRTSQQWLRTMVWQLSIQNGCLSSSSADPSMTFQYPVEISRDLVQMTSQFTHQSMAVHGIGLIEKLFDVACSLTDVLSVLPPATDSYTLGPQDYLTQFLQLIGTIRNGDSRFLPLLLAKVNDALPGLASPMLKTLPDPITNNTSFDNSMPFDKRLESLGSHASNSADSSPYASPPILPASHDFPGLADYNSFPDLTTAPMVMSTQAPRYGHMHTGIPAYPNTKRSYSGHENDGMGELDLGDLPYR